MGKVKTGRPSLRDLLKNVDQMDRPYKFINFKRVIDATGLNQDKVYNNLKGEYHSLTSEERDKIADVLIPNLKKVFETLGYVVRFEKLKK